ncbi:MAG: hypothetical protein IH589_09145 [Anaerolineales bacterium]|nr:hypothetical protein [Anaerolineales bacterium]
MRKKISNKPVLRTFALCEYVVVDKSNRFSLVNIFDKIFLPETPAGYPFNLYVAISVDDKKHNFKVFLESPKGEETKILEVDETTKEDLYAIQVKGFFEFKDFGKYWFNIHVDDNLIGRHFFSVNKAK